MHKKRLTREDSRDLTAQRLLDAAQKLIAKKGLAATSVEDVAAAAGYTRGAFYSNFASKGDLFIALLRRDHVQSSAVFMALRSDALSLDEIQARIRELYGKLYRDNENFLNWTEARMLAVRDRKFRAKLNALMIEKREHVAEVIDYFHLRAGVKPPHSPCDMAMGFIALIEGVKLFMLSSPMDLEPKAAEATLVFFADAVMRAARSPRE